MSDINQEASRFDPATRLLLTLFDARLLLHQLLSIAIPFEKFLQDGWFGAALRAPFALRFMARAACAHADSSNSIGK